MIHLVSCSTSSDMWEKLVTVNEPKSKVTVHLTLQRFYNLPFEGPVTVFISKLDELTHNIKSVGEQISESMIITKILMSLPPKYKHLISVFESVQEPTLRQLPSRLMIEEERSKSEYEEKSIAFIGARRQPGALTRDRKEHKDGLEPENDPVTHLLLLHL
ncbi:unnamed protein product [Arctia plantaginis]|uniref:Uncharacterized protein n=1 Tax=Arctia plantaginis TaxID=874455 RepID=A0A8S1AG81_ARCPL|nr:unnamed protein product [Arctia plantaginis]